MSFSKPALERERLGLFPAADFRLTTGRYQDGPTPKAALWYFQEELIALPYQDRPVCWVDDQNSFPYPPLIWIGAPEILEQVTLSSDGDLLYTTQGQPIRLALVPKISTNRAYYDRSTTAYFQKRTLRLRGMTSAGAGSVTWVARTIWPEDFRIDPERLCLERGPEDRILARLIMAQVDGTEPPLFTRLLWERHPGRPRRWADHAVLAFVLSGAQGDDDEAHGGHLAVATGRFGPQGQWADWLVNNFYPLDAESEKGILAAPVPMDNYLMDLNSGQSYYRPNYMLAVLLSQARAAWLYQAAIEQVFLQFYCHDLVYDHARMNSTALLVDALRRSGWQIPRRGATGFLKALLAFLYRSLKDRSVGSGKKAYDYLIEERTRLLPRVAFEAATRDLLQILKGPPTPPRSLTAYERMLRDDVEAVLFIRIPQTPSSRAFGTYPVCSFEEYGQRVPEDRSQWETVPQKPRPFPSDLRGTQCGRLSTQS